MEGELKRIQADIEQVKRSHKSELDKVTSEMGEVIQRLGKREEVISKLEKDKREVALARDKALKQIEDIDKVRALTNNYLDIYEIQCHSSSRKEIG